jgi:hypothetical protein
VLYISVPLVAIDNTIVNVALPTLNRRINASTADLQWIAALSAAHARVGELRASWVAPGAWLDDHDRSAHVAVAVAVAVAARLLRGTLVPGIAGFRPWFAGPGNRTFELVEYVP